MIDAKTSQRCDQLFNLGLNFNLAYGSYMKDDINVHTTEITCSDDKEWDKIINTITFVIEQRKLFDSIIGLSVIEADLVLQKTDKNYFVHIDENDGKSCVRTCDLNPDRFGVIIKNGKITKVSNG